MIYFDYAATTPVDPEVLKEMMPYFSDKFANPSSAHVCADVAKDAVSAARKVMAELIGASEEEIVFTSGATESNNLAIRGIVECHEDPIHIITSSIEHKSVLSTMKCMEERGHRVTYVDPDRNGNILIEDIEDAFSDDTVLCSIMHVNNEVGSIQNVESIGKLCHDKGIIFHTDATQSFGKIQCRASESNHIDLMSISSHKFYGPKGIGMLYVSKDIPIMCQITGGSQENGSRAGTSNVPGIIGMAAAAKIACKKNDFLRIKELEHEFINKIKSEIPMIFIQGDRKNKIPWITNICFHGVDGGILRDLLGDIGFCVSRASACAKSQDASHVLKSMEVPNELIDSSLRISFGRNTSISDVNALADAIKVIVDRVRGTSSVISSMKLASASL